MIICLSSLKGGSGKTTLAVHLAHAIALSKKKVILIDADPQGSSQGWAASETVTLIDEAQGFKPERFDFS